jgi:hypothetical protein
VLLGPAVVSGMTPCMYCTTLNTARKVCNSTAWLALSLVDHLRLSHGAKDRYLGEKRDLVVVMNQGAHIRGTVR